MKTKFRFFSILTAFIVAVTLFLPNSALASGTITVKPTAMNGWGFVQEVATGTGSFVSGPDTASMGTGSARFTLDATGRELFGTLAYAGTRFDDLTNLEYSTYRSSFDSGNLLAVTLQFDVDYDLTDANTAWQGRLVFEPYFTGGSGNIPEDTWQTWAPLTGMWWASGAPGNTVCPQASPCTWAAVLSAYPNAGLRAAVGVLQFKAGGPWAGFDGNVDAFTIGVSGDQTTYDFEPEPPCTTVCYADAVNGNDTNGGASMANAKKTIQAAIDSVSTGGQVRVLPGDYNETATNRFVLGTNGPHQFGLFLDKNGVTIQGVNASDVPFTDYNALGAYVTTNATNNFGASGIFVQGDNVTIAGLHIGNNIPGDNKTIEIIGDAFTLKDSHVDVPGGGSVYFGDWQFDTGANTSHLQSYTIDHNLIDQSTSIDISSGAGYSGPLAGRQIINNEFENSDYWPSISFNGSGTGVEWFVQSVGGALIEGNTFTNTFNGNDVRAGHIRIRGDYDNSQFDWESYWTDNTFNKAVVILEAAPFSVREYNYTSGSYSFDVRRIGVNIQGSVDKAVTGDTVLVAAGTYSEGQITIGKDLSIVGDPADKPVIHPNANFTGNNASNAWFLVQSGFTFELSDVVLDGSGFNVWQALRSHGLTTVDGVDFQNIRDSGNPYVGVGVGSYGGIVSGGIGSDSHGGAGGPASELNVMNSTFTNIGRIGVIVKGTQSTAQITANTYTGKGDGNWLDYAFELGAGGSAAMTANTVKGNKGVASDASTSAGVLVTTYYGAGTNATITNNFFTNNTTDIVVGYDATDTSTVEAHHNSFTGSTDVAVDSTAPAVDAIENWWGSNLQTNVAAEVSGDVGFTPWLCSGTDTSTAPGFQPDLATLCPYQFTGFFQPIDMNAINIAKAGQTIPIKWRLTDASGLPVSDPSSFLGLNVQSGSCSVAGLPDAIETYSGSSGLQYLGDGNWQYNWKTPKGYAGTCRTMFIKLDGSLTSPTVTFQFK